MKIILSRKGFDSKYGGQPSPILPDGTLLSLPIPIDHEQHSYISLRYGNKTYFDIITELKQKPAAFKKQTCHLDPDIRRKIISSKNQQRSLIFGQSDAAQSHLQKQGVTTGDIFLFFGWFRQTTFINNKLCYVPGAPDQHIIFGYLQIGEIYTNGSPLPKHVLHHPHAGSFYQQKKLNCLYVASPQLSLHKKLPGAGILAHHAKRVLTKPGFTRSRWHLPDYLRGATITYHKNAFKEDHFKSVDIGQEFVIDANEKVLDWVKGILC